MINFFYFLIFLVFCHSANGQNDIVIKGTVIDSNTQLPLELATVYFATVKDSSIIEYAMSDKNGTFSIKTKKYDKPIFLKINYMGYHPYLEKEKSLLDSKDFGKIYLLANVNSLDNVIIKSAPPPIKFKRDTLEFNAPSYKVRPDSNVETLLKQLPGFDVGPDGKITVNGREVNQVLVNGKTFFNRDGTIALKNLPAEIIKKIQVSDFKTKKEELSKQESTSDFSSINITIDKKNNKGYFGKILGGYGSNDRYESSLLLNFFNNKQKISLLASSNNINSMNFAMDEVFDNMGGGRNGKGSRSNDAGDKGITQSNLVGLNYSGDWSKSLMVMGNYNFSNSVNNNESKSDQVSFLPTGNITTISDTKTRNESTGNNINFELEIKINPTTRFVIVPNLNQSRLNNRSTFSSFSEYENGQSLNQSSANLYSESTNSNFGNTINFNKTFKKKTRNFSVLFNNSNVNSNAYALIFSQTLFYQDNNPNDDRNQKGKNTSSNDSYSLELEYTEPIGDSLTIRFGSNFDWRKEIDDTQTFDFDSATKSYNNLDESLTNYTTSKQNLFTPKAGITWQKSKFTVNLNSRTAIINFDSHSLYLRNVTDLNKKYALPYGNFQIKYKFSRSKNLSFKYDYSNTLPTAVQLIPVLNLTNPLNTITGNPDLNPIEKNSADFSFRNYDFRTRSGYSLYIKGNYYNNDVVSTSIYDDKGKRTTTYVNISGTYTTSIEGNWNQSLKRDAHVLKYGFGLNGSYSFDKGFTNAVLFNAKSTAISPKVNLTYEYGELLIVAPSYSLSYNQTNYENSSRPANSNIVHRINLQTTSYWPENLIFGNDFGYTYNSNISSNFKKNFYLWNTSLSYSFFDKKVYAKIKIYDVLNKNLSATRTISTTSIRDEENTVLKRYVMFSLSYKIENFARADKIGKKKQGM